MRIDEITDGTEDNNASLYVANRDFDLVPNSEYKGYNMADTSIDDDDGFVKLNFDVCKFVKTTSYTWNGREYKQDNYRFIHRLIDPRRGNSPSPYGRFGKFTNEDLDAFGITDPKQREAKLGTDITYRDMYRYTVDALVDGRLQPEKIPTVKLESDMRDDSEKIDSMFGPGTSAGIAKDIPGTGVVFMQDSHGRNWKIIRQQGVLRLERDYMLEGDVVMFEGKRKALVGTIVKLSEDAIVLEGGTFDFSDEDLEEGIGKWIGAAALAGLLGLGANQLLDPGAAERTPLGQAMAAAAAKGDTYAARELKNLGMYMEVGAYDQLAGLKDTYLDVNTKGTGLKEERTPSAVVKKIMKHAREAMWDWVDSDLRRITDKDLKKQTLANLKAIFDDQIPNLARQANTARLKDASHMLKHFKISLADWNRMLDPYKEDMLSDLDSEVEADPSHARLSLLSLAQTGLAWPEIAKLSAKARKLDVAQRGGEDTFSSWHVSPEDIMANRNKMVGKSSASVTPPRADGKPNLRVVKELDGTNESDAANAITKAFSGMADSVKVGLIKRAGLLAMQGRYSEAENAMRSLLKDVDPKSASTIITALKNIKPVTIGGKVADSSALDKSASHDEWLTKTLVPWVQNLMSKGTNESLANWNVGIMSMPRTSPFKLKKIVATSPRGKTYTFDTEQEAVQHFSQTNWDKIKDPATGWKVDMNNTKPELDEAEYHGRTVKLGKPMAGDVKKYKVYVKDPKTGNVKKVNFGDKGMEIKRDDPERRKNFRARHGCGTPRASDRTKAAYWSCRMWSSKPVSKILKGK